MARYCSMVCWPTKSHLNVLFWQLQMDLREHWRVCMEQVCFSLQHGIIKCFVMCRSIVIIKLAMTCKTFYFTLLLLCNCYIFFRLNCDSFPEILQLVNNSNPKIVQSFCKVRCRAKADVIMDDFRHSEVCPVVMRIVIKNLSEL